MLSKHWRLVFAVVVLATSLAVLAWSFLPGARIVRRQKIQPTEMQLPTPGSYVPSQCSLAWLDKSMEAVRAIHGADRFVLLILGGEMTGKAECASTSPPSVL